MITLPQLRFVFDVECVELALPQLRVFLNANEYLISFKVLFNQMGWFMFSSLPKHDFYDTVYVFSIIKHDLILKLCFNIMSLPGLSAQFSLFSIPSR